MNTYDVDLDSIKGKLKEFIRDNTEFKDYNFEGSALSQLMDILAYSIQYPTFYLNMIANELHLSTSNMESNVYKHAKTLNYLPKRKVAPRIRVKISKPDNAAGYVIPAFTKFTMGSLFLTNTEEIHLQATLPTVAYLIEGEMISEEFVSNGEPFQTYILKSRESIDDNNLYVYVNRNVDSTPWICANTTNPMVDTNSFYIDYFEQFTIKFDNGRLFKYPHAGDTVTISYLKTGGAKYNGAGGTVKCPDYPIEIDSTGMALTDGLEEESIESIKNNAPLFFTTMNRAITERDYNIIAQKYSKYDNYNGILVWGGEKEYIDENRNILEEAHPVHAMRDVGNIYFSILRKIPGEIDGIIYPSYRWPSEQEFFDISNFMTEYKILTLFFRNVFPNIIEITPKVDIKLNITVGVNTNDIADYINNHFSRLSGFNSRVRKSKEMSFIDAMSIVDYTVLEYPSYAAKIEVLQSDIANKVVRLYGPIVPGSINSHFISVNTITGGAFVEGDTVYSNNSGNPGVGIITNIGSIRPGHTQGFMSIQVLSGTFAQGNSITSGSVTGFINTLPKVITDSGGMVKVNGVNFGTINYQTGFMNLNFNQVSPTFGTDFISASFNFTYESDEAFDFQRETYLHFKKIKLNIL